MHLFPNKGGLLVAFEVDGSRVSLISCHLAAHEGVKKCQERNESIMEILGGVRSEDPRFSSFDIMATSHHVIWMGDMNYRLTNDPTLPSFHRPHDDRIPTHGVPPLALEDNPLAESPRSERSENTKKDRIALMQRVLSEISQERWDSLVALDELNREIRSGRALVGFTALTPSFPPTFKRRRAKVIQPLVSPSMGKVWNMQWSADKSKFKETIKEDDSQPLLQPGQDQEGEDESPDTTDNSLSDNFLEHFYDPKRIPSYTDRILYYSSPSTLQAKRFLVSHEFNSAEEVDSSDHKPVFARLVLQTLGPRPQLTNVERSGLYELVFSNLKGSDLDEKDAAITGGGSDPYIKITGDTKDLLAFASPSQVEVRGPTIQHNLNPVWPGDLVATLNCTDLSTLPPAAHVVLSVWDEDRAKSDDLIGFVSLPLALMVEAHVEGRPFIFDAFLLNQGVCSGHLSGQVTIRLAASPIHSASSSLCSNGCTIC